MELEDLKTIAALVQSGGPVAMGFIIYFAMKATNSAKEVAANIKAMHDTMTQVAPKVNEIADDVKDIDKRTEHMEEMLERKAA